MIKVKAIGGLGNQLFQYATARAIAEKRGDGVVVDMSDFSSYKTHPFCLNKFRCKATYESKPKLINKLLSNEKIRNSLQKLGFIKKYYFETQLPFNEDVLLNNSINYLTGYFQSEKYFLSIRECLLEELTLIEDLNIAEIAVSKAIKNAKNSISIHIRRGDYVSNEGANKTHGVCDSDYFKKALNYFSERKLLDEHTELFIFSDDIEWCRNNLSFDYKMNFVDGSSERPEVDMVLMSQCKHQVISNSTFSWWGAWLNKNDEKVVVAPKEWFKSTDLDSTDIVPNQWIKL